MEDLRGKVAVVTGASSGIGLATANLLARSGASVVFASRRLDALEAATETLRKEGVFAHAARLDVCDRDNVHQVVRDTVTTFGRLDYLFNNAGFGLLADPENTSPEHWERVLGVNLMGVAHGVEAAYPIMIAQRSGHIVNTASLAGLMPVPLSMAYVAAKHAVVGLSHSLRLDARRHGVRVSVVCPAAVDTPMFANAEYVSFDAAKMLENVPGGAMSADQCARAVLDGVLANKETIVPGPAGVMWRLNRFMPALSRALALSIGKKMSAMRAAPAPRPLASPH